VDYFSPASPVDFAFLRTASLSANDEEAPALFNGPMSAGRLACQRAKSAL
jgi:hypothetical protein